MNRGPYKMQGMSFKGETPVRKINFSKVSGKIKNSKFGKTGLGEVVGNVTGEIGNVQEKYKSAKSKITENIGDGIDSLLNSDNATPANVDPIALDDSSLPTVPVAGESASALAKKKKKKKYKK